MQAFIPLKFSKIKKLITSMLKNISKVKIEQLLSFLDMLKISKCQIIQKFRHDFSQVFPIWKLMPYSVTFQGTTAPQHDSKPKHGNADICWSWLCTGER